MATDKRQTTVIIAGSGLTGLTLALMLQQLGVPYLLLEAYDSCTPNVGASIALQPNGLRIFHQLGILKDVEAIYQPVGQLMSGDAETYVQIQPDWVTVPVKKQRSLRKSEGTDKTITIQAANYTSWKRPRF